MYVQRNCNRVGGYYRPNRKCFSFKGSLIFVLLVMACLIVQEVAARTSQDEDLTHHLDVNGELKNANNLQTAKLVKAADNVSQQNHPIIIYKEDLVSEDYVPSQNETKTKKHTRLYKDIAHKRHHKKQNFTDVVIEEKPQKMLFDILPEKPIIVPEEMEKHKKPHLKLMPLTDYSSDEVKETDKELQKKPKKFHGRVRRSASGQHILHKRNPYFRQIPKVAGDIVPTQVQYIYVKHSVPGKKHNGLDIPIPGPQVSSTAAPKEQMQFSIGQRIGADENDRVIFSSRRTTARPTQRPPNESIFRDPRPQNFDFSFMNPQSRTTTTRPIFSRLPQTKRQEEESIFRDPSPQNFDFSFMNPQAQQSSLTTTSVAASTARAQPTVETGISQCVWAIVNCCSAGDTNIRYACFEQNGCYGAFWGLNPCADNVRDSFVNFVADYYN